MKNKIAIISFILLFFSLSSVKAQELANYNLYIQNSYLYNPASSFTNSGLSAFLNSHIQWVGFDEAPQVNTFGIHGGITENSALGLSVIDNTSGAVKNLTVRLNYAYKAKFADNHYLQLGTGLGFSNDNFSGANKFTDLADPVLTSDEFVGGSFSASAGLLYVNKGFEAQFVMPQMYWRKAMNLYSMAILAYNYELNSDWAVKPSVLARGVGTSPIQYDVNVMGTWNKMIWAQAGYRSNNSVILGLGVNYNSFNLGYAYQMNNSELAHVSNGTHEIQLVYNFAGFSGEPKSVPVRGMVKSAVGNKSLVAQIAFITTENVKRNTTSYETGNYSIRLKKNNSYNVQVYTEGYYPHADVMNVGEENVEKTLDYTLIPLKGTLSGVVLREGNNKPLVATIDIFDKEVKIDSLKTNAKGAYSVELRSGKDYTFTIKANNCEDKTINVPIKTRMVTEKLNFNLDGYIALSGTVLSNENNSEIASTIEIKKDGTVVETLNGTGKYTVSLLKGNYVLTVKSARHIAKKVSVKLSSNKEKFVQNVNLDKLNLGEAFQLGAIKFKSGTSELTKASFAILNKLVTTMNGDETLRVELTGYTDDTGTAEGNQTISEERAKTCVDYLISKGIAATRLEAKGLGQSKPLVPNNSPANKAKNRRVEFKFID